MKSLSPLPELRSWQEIYTQHLGQWDWLLSDRHLLPEFQRQRTVYALETGMKLMVCEALGL